MGNAMMTPWILWENVGAMKRLVLAPKQVQKKYGLWKNMIFDCGPQELRHHPGFRDEALTGRWSGYRSSRLSLQWRVIYRVERSTVTVFVEEITPHEY